jgi:hypothetical protein
MMVKPGKTREHERVGHPPDQYGSHHGQAISEYFMISSSNDSIDSEKLEVE